MKLVPISVITMTCFGVSLLAPNFYTGNRRMDDPLPQKTRLGENTFGCLVNNEPWVAQGNSPAPSLLITFDPGYNGGSLEIAAHQVKGSDHTYIYLNRDGIASVGDYPLAVDAGRVQVTPGACGQALSGALHITRLSMEERIVSGTFEFTLSGTSCDDWVCSKGRFDGKF